MSLWLRRKDQRGRTWLRSVPFDPLLIIAIVGLAAALLMPAIAALKLWLLG